MEAIQGMKDTFEPVVVKGSFAWLLGTQQPFLALNNQAELSRNVEKRGKGEASAVFRPARVRQHRARCRLHHRPLARRVLQNPPVQRHLYHQYYRRGQAPQRRHRRGHYRLLYAPRHLPQTLSYATLCSGAMMCYLCTNKKPFNKATKFSSGLVLSYYACLYPY
jgi:hypothetical protein